MNQLIPSPSHGFGRGHHGPRSSHGMHYSAYMALGVFVVVLLALALSFLMQGHKPAPTPDAWQGGTLMPVGHAPL